MSLPPDKKEETGRFSLRRWSQRKREVVRATNEAQKKNTAEAPSVVVFPPNVDAAAGGAVEGVSPLVASELGAQQQVGKSGEMRASAKAEFLPLPDISTLTSESDFSVFMRGGVDEATRLAAVKKLFQSPEFNVMDGLDIYIDDYSKSEPLTPSMLEHFKTLAEKLAGTVEDAVLKNDAAEAGQAGTAGLSVAAKESAGKSGQVSSGVQPDATAPEVAHSHDNSRSDNDAGSSGDSGGGDGGGGGGSD